MERKNQDVSSQEERITRRSFLKRLISISGSGEDASLIDTVKLTTAFYAVEMVTLPAASYVEKEGVGINTSKSTEQMLKMVKENPVQAFLLGSLIGPAFEEGLFRIIPSLMLNGLEKTGTMWKVGIPISIVFGTIHGLSVDENDRKVQWTSLPIYETAAGMFLWKMVRERGYLHAVVAHSTLNTISFILSLLAPIPAPESTNTFKKQVRA